jgi:hypothetical protein
MFDMGKQYISSIFEIIKDPENQALVKSIKEADKQKCDFKDKIRFLYKYYLEYIERTKVMNLKRIYDRIDAKRLIFDVRNIEYYRDEMGIDEEVEEFIIRKSKEQERCILMQKGEFKEKLLVKVREIEDDLQSGASIKIARNNIKTPGSGDRKSPSMESRQKAMLSKQTRQDTIDNVCVRSGLTNDMYELFEYADYLKRMIDEIEFDDRGNVKKTAIEQSAGEILHYCKRNNRGIGLNLLKQSAEVAHSFNQANYLFYNPDDGVKPTGPKFGLTKGVQSSAKKKKPLSGTSWVDAVENNNPSDEGINSEEDFYRGSQQNKDVVMINESIKLDLKKVLIDDPGKFRKFFNRYDVSSSIGLIK